VNSLKKQTKEGVVTIFTSIIDAGKTLPFAATIVGLAKVALAKSEQFRQKKIAMFLKATAEISPQQIEAIFKDLDDGGKEFTERVLLVIEKLDNERKVKILSNLSVAMFQGFVTVEDFERLSIAVEATYYGDLEYFNKHFKMTEEQIRREREEDQNKPMEENAVIKRRVAQNNRLKLLVPSRLVDEENRTTMYGVSGSINAIYTISSLGQILLDFGF
jgi:hypothetical protein